MTRRTGSRGRIAVALFACFCGGVIAGWYLHAGAPVPARGPAEAGHYQTKDVASSPNTKDPTSPPDVGSRVPSTAAPSTTPPSVVSGFSRTADAVATTGALADLRTHNLQMPIDGATVESMKGDFDERRDAGERPHEAVDMLAPRNMPVHAVDNGTIAKLFLSKAGGNTIYQYDPSGRFCYYYAHLERYADGLREGAAVTRGDVIGFVGTSGNAPANTPHLHFAVFELTSEHHWWQGTAIDPYLVFHR